MGSFEPQPPFRSLPRKIGYLLCATFGAILVFFVAFVVLVEITTAPARYGWWMWGSLIAAGISFAHVLREVYSFRPVSWRSWLVFAVALCVLVFDVWITIKDPTARIVFSAAIALGGTMLFLARLLRTNA